MRKLFEDLMSDILLVVLAGDLLYLYFGGAWYDPNRAIELAELAALSLIVLWGFWRFYRHVKRARNKIYS